MSGYYSGCSGALRVGAARSRAARKATLRGILSRGAKSESRVGGTFFLDTNRKVVATLQGHTGTTHITRKRLPMMKRSNPVLFLLVQGAFAATRWSPRVFPNPEANPRDCHSQGSARICDPDGILGEDAKNSLVDAISAFEETYAVPCSSIKTEEEDGFDVQIAVALVNKMDLLEYRNFEDKEKHAAEDFAISLHNKWGVGVDSPCGGTGVLVFLSMDDRAIFISTGDAIKKVLTNHRLDKVMSEMKPLLRQVKYGEALQKAVYEIGRHVEAGEPDRSERMWEFLSDAWPFAMFASIIGFVALQGRLQQRRQREYARVQTQLTELDRHRAEALQGRYQCTSCPICLNDFESENGDDNSSSEAPMIGSDGLPLRLLRCGHVFDETCWTEWIETGQGNCQKCPICNQDVGAPIEPDRSESSDQFINEDIRLRGGAIQEQEPRALRRYNEDRMFRLARMSLQFPRYINHNQVQRWSDPRYDQSLARDSSFTRRNPVQYTKYTGGHNSNGFRGSSNRGFGGGRSSGGRGGSW